MYAIVHDLVAHITAPSIILVPTLIRLPNPTSIPPRYHPDPSPIPPLFHLANPHLAIPPRYHPDTTSVPPRYHLCSTLQAHTSQSHLDPTLIPRPIQYQRSCVFLCHRHTRKDPSLRYTLHNNCASIPWKFCGELLRRDHAMTNMAIKKLDPTAAHIYERSVPVFPQHLGSIGLACTSM